MRTLNDLLLRANALEISDLHLHTHEKPWIRVAGELRRWDEEDPITRDEMRGFMRESGSETSSTVDSSYERAFHSPGVGRVRATWYLTRRERAGSLRILPDKVPSAIELHLPTPLLDLSLLTSGLILVTGSTGSGKSTVCASLIDRINQTRSSHILTIEQPVEYKHQSKKSLLTQIEVGSDISSWELAVKTAMRQDPDVLLLGEVRDIDTAQAALQAAATGHLVIATMHADSPYLALERFLTLLGNQESRLIVASTIEAIIGCQLIANKNKNKVLPLLDLVRFDQTWQDSLYKNTPWPSEKAAGSLTISEQMEYFKRLGQI